LNAKPTTVLFLPLTTPIPFADLTEELVVGWVKEALGGQEKVDEIEAMRCRLN
jgi:hypothetical protein